MDTISDKDPLFQLSKKELKAYATELGLNIKEIPAKRPKKPSNMELMVAIRKFLDENPELEQTPEDVPETEGEDTPETPSEVPVEKTVDEEVKDANKLQSALNAYRQDGNLKGMNLKGLDFSNMDLRGADFSGANIQGCNFEGAILQGCKFHNVKSDQHTAFEGADLRWSVGL